jgi:hypothetical protein
MMTVMLANRYLFCNPIPSRNDAGKKDLFMKRNGYYPAQPTSWHGIKIFGISFSQRLWPSFVPSLAQPVP